MSPNERPKRPQTTTCFGFGGRAGRQVQGCSISSKSRDCPRIRPRSTDRALDRTGRSRCSPARMAAQSSISAKTLADSNWARPPDSTRRPWRAFASSTSLPAKRELLPKPGTIAFVVNKNSGMTPFQIQEMQASAQAVGQPLLVVSVDTEEEIDKAFAMMAERNVAAVL